MPSSKDLSPSSKGFGSVFFHNQFRAKPQYPPKSTNLSGKTAIITGANQGLGLEAGRQLLALHLSHLILAVRTPKKGEDAAAELRQKYPKAAIEVWQLDMLSYDSIQAFARRADAQLTRLDFVILNAGIMSTNYRLNAATNQEEIIQVNYLSTILLATLLLPIAKAKKTPGDKPCAITLVNSGLAYAASFKNRTASPLLPSFADEKSFDAQQQYNTSKLLAHFWLWRAQDYINPADCTVTLVDPSYVAGTSLGRDQPAFLKPIGWLFGKIAGRSVPVGASTYVDAVVTKGGAESHGGYLMSWEVQPFAKVCYGEEGEQVRERLWAETMRELAFAGVEGVLEGMRGGKGQ